MKKWTASEIKNLRLRMGWSVADFSRYFGGETSLIFNWELGAQTPTPEDVLQFNRLAQSCNNYSEQVSRRPLADCVLTEFGLAQVHTTEIKDLSNKT